MIERPFCAVLSLEALDTLSHLVLMPALIATNNNTYKIILAIECYQALSTMITSSYERSHLMSLVVLKRCYFYFPDLHLFLTFREVKRTAQGHTEH